MKHFLYEDGPLTEILINFKRLLDGHSWMVGPFCGAFIPKGIDGAKPFTGVAFKVRYGGAHTRLSF